MPVLAAIGGERVANVDGGSPRRLRASGSADAVIGRDMVRTWVSGSGAPPCERTQQCLT